MKAVFSSGKRIEQIKTKETYLGNGNVLFLDWCVSREDINSSELTKLYS